MVSTRIFAWFALGLLVLNNPAHSEPVRATPEANHMTRFEQRFSELRKNYQKAPDSAVFWKEAQAMIMSSNAANDANADMDAGKAGFMTHANNSIAERPVAPGIKCLDRSETSRYALYLFAYHDPLPPELGKALLAFDIYARSYNAAMLRSGALGDTSCIPAGW